MWLLISDTHDNLDKLKKLPNIIKKNSIKTIFHCGDFISPFTLKFFMYENVDFYGVFGNNDGERVILSQKSNVSIVPGPRFLEINNKKIYMMHEPYSLKAAKNSKLYDYIFFGHTHEKFHEQMNNTQIINPGEGSGWLTNQATYVIINPENNKIEFKVL
ncbi:phosphoesterase [Tepiditoga spiralis]|uniref:Phosphoesterase n=1 Tax=Tepiditoga spiralis TaxID=2108365 RepID=A0A7G1G8R5_9BACT|nr:metallophosphoesterase [Tepiditoga spiralis]BBE31634.1 phosphoesterase [Tepiditoga spiralis]